MIFFFGDSPFANTGLPSSSTGATCFIGDVLLGFEETLEASLLPWASIDSRGSYPILRINDSEKAADVVVVFASCLRSVGNRELSDHIDLLRTIDRRLITNLQSPQSPSQASNASTQHSYPLSASLQSPHLSSPRSLATVSVYQPPSFLRG